jgi:tetratricopeptide (TPR) repeat protein
MNKMKLIFLILMVLMVFLLGPEIAAEQSVSKVYLKEARECGSLEDGKKLITKYEKLSDSNPYKSLYLGIVYHNLSSPKNEDYLNKALEFTRRAVGKTKNPLASGYYGSTLTIQAGAYYEKGDMMGAMSKLTEGIEKMDKAVEQDPDNIDLRMLRILNSYALSGASPINRFNIIKKDLAFLKQKYQSLSSLLKSFYNLYSGLMALKDNNTDQAVAYFEQAIKCAPRSSYAKLAKRRIDGLNKSVNQ